MTRSYFRREVTLLTPDALVLTMQPPLRNRVNVLVLGIPSLSIHGSSPNHVKLVSHPLPHVCKPS